MKQEEIIYLDKEGYENYLISIENLVNNLTMVEKEMNLAKENNDVSKYRDLLELKENMKARITKLKNDLTKIKIIEKNDNEEILDIGDVVKIRSYYSKDEVEEEICELVAGRSDCTTEIEKLSINSPKGEKLYGAKVGSTKYYQIGRDNIRVDILEKIKVKKLIK